MEKPCNENLKVLYQRKKLEDDETLFDFEGNLVGNMLANGPLMSVTTGFSFIAFERILGSFIPNNIITQNAMSWGIGGAVVGFTVIAAPKVKAYFAYKKRLKAHIKQYGTAKDFDETNGMDIRFM